MIEVSETWDTIIVGGAGAALTAAMYAARRKLKTLVIAKSIGGQAAMTDAIENYPGFMRIGGIPLMQKFLKQALKAGAQVIYEEAKGIKENGKEFEVETNVGQHKAKTVILSFGKTPRNLDVLGEKEFANKGVSYCSNCDMPLFSNKTIAVVGGGNSALDAAIYGSKVCKKVYLIHRRDQFRGFESLIDIVSNQKKIETLLNTTVKEIKGDATVKSIAVQNVNTNEEREITVDGVFVEVGSIVKTEFIKNLVKLDSSGQIIINNNCETYYPGSDKIRLGIFAAGDVTQTPFKQIIVSAGEGCKAALQAYNYLHGMQPKFSADWVAKNKAPKLDFGGEE